MTCPSCHSFELDATAHCNGCGRQLSVAEELRLRASLVVPRAAIAEDRFDYAVREA